MSYTISSLDKALTILEVLANRPGSGVTEIAQQTGSTKSQVFRLLYTLEQRGYVRKDVASRTYSLGYRTLYLGDKTRQQMNLIEATSHVLDELAAECGENVHLLERDGRNCVCVALRQSPQSLRLYAQVGRRGPLHAGGGSTVLLAHAPDEVREAVLASQLEVFTPATVTDPDRLRKILARVRKQGYHDSKDDLDDGAYSIAAPIRDHQGTVVAALSIAGPVSRLNESVSSLHRRLVVEYAEKASVVLGWEAGQPAVAV
jgi:IclR family KDG regulon transcriptional repressor